MITLDEIMDIKTFMRLAYLEAEERSTDTSTKNGAVLLPRDQSLVLVDANRMPHPSMDDDEENWRRPRKYKVIAHAEQAVILKAARMNIETVGSVLICPWACCNECAKNIVLAGVDCVIAHKEAVEKTAGRNDQWQELVELGRYILDKAGVEYELWSGTVGGDIPNLYNGEIWYP